MWAPKILNFKNNYFKILTFIFQEIYDVKIIKL
jgi:hypothetical protein